MSTISRRDFCMGLGALSGAMMLPTALRASGQQQAPVGALGIAQASAGETVSAQQKGRMAWWQQARLGLFIHWGLYAIPARGEWVQWNEQIPIREYAKLADQFTIKHFDADEWADVAKDSGAGYTVLTARHHDGFALFDDPGNPFTSVSTSARRDIVDEYATAVRKAGLHPGLYYSPLDWRFPGFFFPNLQLENAEQMRTQYHRQIRQLMSNYGQIDELWFDGGESDWLSFGHEMGDSSFPKLKPGQHYHGRFSWQGEKVDEIIRNLQPQIIVNNRAADVPPDFESREWRVGDFDCTTPWECAYPLAGYWGYMGDKDPLSLKDAIQLLANVAGRDGNLLLNIGPRADGSIVPSHVQRLREIGAWLNKYGESIRDTRGGPFMPASYGVSTHNNNRVYVHVLDAAKRSVRLPPIPARVLRASSLTGERISFAQSPGGIDLTLEMRASNEIDAIVTLDLDQSAAGISPVQVV